jgi:exonuclease SbcC
MTPLRLELEGFTCFREPTTIDLSEIGVDLFAIAGPTGAGKSTLLDAMTYALYGQTARLGSRGLDALLSPGAERLTVQLAFRTAGGVFRVTRLAWQRVNRVERQTRIEQLDEGGAWRQLPESEKLSEANEKLAEVVGLDYDGFTRAVLLPQGAFDEFLRGDAGKRRRLLTVLLGLDRVQAMQQLAGRYSREAESKVEALRRRLAEDFAGATPERRRELHDERRSAELERDTAVADAETLTAALAEMDELMRWSAELTTVEAERAQLASEEVTIASDRVRLTSAQRAETLWPLIERQRLLAERARSSETERVELERNVAEAASALARARTSADGAERQLGERGGAIAQRLERLAAVAPLAQRLARAGGAPAEAVATERTPFDDAAWELLEGLRQQLPALERLAKNLRSGRSAVSADAAAIAELNAAITTEAQALEALVVEGQEAAAHRTALGDALDTARRANLAASLQAGLKVGDACPICGAPIRSLADHDGADVEAARAAFERADGARTALRERYAAAREAIKLRRSTLDERRQRLELRRGEVEAAAAELEQLRRPFAAAALPDEPGAAIRERRGSLLADLAATVHQVTGGEDAETLRTALNEERSRLQEGQRRTQRELADVERRLEGVQGRSGEVLRRLEELRADLGAADAEQQGALARTGFATVADALSARMSEGQRLALERRIATFAERRNEIERRAAELNERLAGRGYDAGTHAALRERRSTVGDRLSELQRRLGALESEITRLDEMLERARGLREELQGEEANYDIYRRLSLDLRSDQFQEFLMTRVQRELARRASHIVRDVTDGRYDLRLADGEYQVLDGWSGGEARSAKTLSGGETFIASLALALALSDTVAGSHALGALFLDEGFGSLDGETLDAVAGVLEALTSEGRMVGIITHVQALSERMPARLLVSKGPHGSSVRWDL